MSELKPGNSYVHTKHEETHAEPEFLFEAKPVFDTVKRIMDVICSLMAILVLLPFMIIIAAAIMVDDFGNPIFVQRRTGKDGKIFRMLKFRSMYMDAEKRRSELLEFNEVDGPIFKLREDPRMTKVGKLLRRTSMDELPQLFNILLGSMSVVGPRPLVTYEQAGCNPYQANRLLVKPGLSCYWQVSGRSDTTFDEMIELDLKYIKERGIFTDINIIIKTVVVVLQSKGAY
jgi:lipopolysaccharide/colanic/teichoic acid biosynthesis glycosyltransferase